MTVSERRGLDIARKLLAQEIEDSSVPRTFDDEEDMVAAMNWIIDQQVRDRLRRRPRGAYAPRKRA